jgi:hypothetical protein
VELLAAAVNKQGKMVVVLAGLTGSGDAIERILLYTTRMLEIPETENDIQEAPTQLSSAATVTPATVAFERSPTPASVVDSEPASPQDQTSTRISPFTMALLPVALLLLSVLGIVLWRAVQAKDQ